jgi:hypothetical protein
MVMDFAAKGEKAKQKWHPAELRFIARFAAEFT